MRNGRLRFCMSMAAAVCFAFAGTSVLPDAGPQLSDQAGALLSLERDGLDAVSASHLAQLTQPATRGEAGFVQYDATWLSQLRLRAIDEQSQCLVTALYHEARGESIEGQFAVAEVILNRVDVSEFPDTTCGVVFQNAHRRNGCQFSFACDGRSDDMADRDAADMARRIAQVMTEGAPRPLTDGATYFHATWVSPNWASDFTETASIGVHIFYRTSTRVSSN
jgi:spore germination cell wall hydrolase CwlJ-like protein